MSTIGNREPEMGARELLVDEDNSSAERIRWGLA
jgi:hypothetical protein